MAPDDDKPAPPGPDPTVKELLERDLGKPLDELVDAATAAELQRWFGMPSFEQLAEQDPGARPESAEDLARREQREKALASVEPWMLDALHARHERAWGLMTEVSLDLHVDPEIALFDTAMAARLNVVAEPRELERPADIEDELAHQTPQALLRDLHRAELYFDKLFEISEVPAEQRFDIVAEVKSAMSTSWRLPTLQEPSSVAIKRIFAEVRAERNQPWATLHERTPLHNRRAVAE